LTEEVQNIYEVVIGIRKKKGDEGKKREMREKKGRWGGKKVRYCLLSVNMADKLNERLNTSE
jgi:hypothetical protein